MTWHRGDAMQPNPGGQVDAKDVIGRDELIKRIWERLEVQSLSLTAERRTGKTCVLKKMEKEARKKWVPIYQDLEGVGTAAEFVEAVYGEVSHLFSRWGKAEELARNVAEWLGGKKIKGQEIPEFPREGWKPRLERLIDVLLKNQALHRVVFFWDEFPWMIEKIAQKEGNAVAMEVLDVIRMLRQTRPDFRAVLTGSVGLHHILDALKRDGYGNEPVNDTGPKIEVPALSAEFAKELVNRLIATWNFRPKDCVVSVEAIARESGGVPYYIHALVDEMRSEDFTTLTAAKVTETVNAMLRRTNDPWDFRHYVTRIPRYFKENEAVVLGALNVLAARDEPATTKEVLHELSQSMAVPGLATLRDLLRLLVLDHYLDKTDDGYTFRLPLLKRWWVFEHELGD